MADDTYIFLDGRGVLGVGGPDARIFLQGLISNDVTKATADRVIYASLLTPQGRYLHDFFVVELGDGLALETESGRIGELARRLQGYVLRSDVAIADLSDQYGVFSLPGTLAPERLGLAPALGAAREFAGGVAFADPRLARLGARAIVPAESGRSAIEAAGFAAAPVETYDRLRLDLGIPEGSVDLQVGKALLLESGFNELHGIDWQKGCFVGQELTARLNYRGLVRKRLVPVAIEGPAPAPESPILFDDVEAGVMRSSRGKIGLALLRLEAMKKAVENGRTMTAGEAQLTPLLPDWIDLPD